MLIFTSLLAFYLAFNLGANDVANSMGTSVGSKALTLKQALIIAGVLEFMGALLFGQSVSARLAKGVVNLNLFADTPQLLLVGMVAVMLAAGIWLNIATAWGLPVSSSHAVVGAIAGFACLAVSPQVVQWQSLGIISLTWIITPLLSGAIAALVYGVIKSWILDHPDPIAQLQEWIPWLSAALVGVFSVIVLPTLLQTPFIASRLPPLPLHTVGIVLSSIAILLLSIHAMHRLFSVVTVSGLPVQSAENKNDSPPVLLMAPSPEPLLARFQILSAGCVAFAHGSNDVGNAIAPFATIFYIQQTGALPASDFQMPLWILGLGGSGIVTGLAIWGKSVIATVGEGIIALQPSGGFCAELATAATVLLASRLGLPISTSHALVGAVIGVGLIKNGRSIQLKTLRGIWLSWLATIPIAASLSAVIFVILRFLLISR